MLVTLASESMDQIFCKFTNVPFKFLVCRAHILFKFLVFRAHILQGGIFYLFEEFNFP